jgi:hypothetical protein
MEPRMTTASEHRKHRRNAFIATGITLALLATATGYAVQQMPEGGALSLNLFGMEIHLAAGDGPRALALTFREAS